MTRTRDEAKVTEAKRLYGLGLTTYAIAAQVDADPRTVQRWVADVIRPRGPRKRPDVRDQLVLDLRDRESLSFAEIARRVHMSRTGVRMRYYALTGRERPERAKGAAPVGLAQAIPPPLSAARPPSIGVLPHVLDPPLCPSPHRAPGGLRPHPRRARQRLHPQFGRGQGQRRGRRGRGAGSPARSLSARRPTLLHVQTFRARAWQNGMRVDGPARWG